MSPINKTVKRLKTKRGNAQRSELEKQVRKVIEDVSEALRRGDPGAVDAILRLEAGAKALMSERRAVGENADTHRQRDDDAEDEGDPTP